MKLSQMNKQQLLDFKTQTEAEYGKFKAQGLSLDMSRGKPAPDQLELSMDMLNVFDDKIYKSESGFDCRNYGLLDGIPDAKKLFAPMIGVNTDEIIIFGNSSLSAMYWAVQTAYTHGVLGSKPWCSYDKVSH